MKKGNLQKKIEFPIHILTLLFLLDAFEPLWRDVSGFPYDPVEGDPIQRGILLSGYLLTIPILLLYPKTTSRLVIKSPLLWLMVLWAAVSILWSGSPDITLRRVIAVLLTTLYALVLYLRFSFSSFLRLLGAVFFIAILSSLMIVVFKPEWGIMSSIHDGAWRGVFIHKNILGKASAFALCFFTAIWSSSRKRRERIFWIGASVLSVIALVGSRSATAMVVVGTLFFGAILLKAARPWRKELPVFLMIILIIGSGVILLFIQNSEDLFEVFGRDVSLTGRIPLWQVLILMGLKQPFGYGYGAFWLGWNGPSAEVWSKLNWFLPNAHNGFFQLWLDLGWVGLGLGVILLGKIFIKKLPLVLAGSKEAVFWMLFVIIFVTYNFVEVTFFDQNNIYWVLIAYAYMSTQMGESKASLSTA